MRKINVFLGVFALFCLNANAWEIKRNPDRFPSIGLHVGNLNLSGDRTETVITTTGKEFPYRNSEETIDGWKGGFDLRLPATKNITFTFGYDRVEMDDYFTRRNTLGGDQYKEKIVLDGYSYDFGIRFYLSK